jgi:hypothetical protein
MLKLILVELFVVTKTLNLKDKVVHFAMKIENQCLKKQK